MHKKENFHIVVYVSKNPMHCMCLGLAGCIGGYWKRTEPGTHIVTFLHTDTNKASTIQEDLNWNRLIQIKLRLTNIFFEVPSIRLKLSPNKCEKVVVNDVLFHTKSWSTGGKRDWEEEKRNVIKPCSLSHIFCSVSFVIVRREWRKEEAEQEPLEDSCCELFVALTSE